MYENSDVMPVDPSTFAADDNSSDDEVEEELRPHGNQSIFVLKFLYI
jgi:hypothetical protein